jgi:signal transduction histidine kinase/CheY-like chemotaxis protein
VVANAEDRVFDPAVWQPALEAFGAVTHLTVQLYDRSGEVGLGPIPSTPLFALVAGNGQAFGFAECAEECRTRTESDQVVIQKFSGLALVGTSLRLAGDVVGMAVGGYALSEFSTRLGLQRLARDRGLEFDAVWNLARAIAPVPVPRLSGYGELLRVLGEALLREHARSRESARLFQAAQEANRSKDEFLSTVSHELRTPLNAILGWTQILRLKRSDTTMVDRAVDTIERNANAQTRLIDDLLDVSRIVAGKVNLEFRIVELVPLIELAIDVVRPGAEAKGIELTSIVEDSTERVVGDPDRLQQIVLNLLSNAVKFTSQSGRITVRLRRVDRHAEIAVSDTGQGIAPEVLPLIFDRFRQADSATTRRHGGLGLGLAIVRHLVERHGGQVHAASPGEGRGATFTVTLPLADIAETSEVETRALMRRHRTRPQGPPTIHALEGLRVVVVDDEADAREWLSTMLEQFGARVTAVESAAAALEALDAVKPAVLVVDVGMPGVDGYTFVQRVRARTPEQGGRTPAVAVTAYASREDRARAMAAGFDDHLPKPVHASELVPVIATLSGRAA